MAGARAVVVAVAVLAGCAKSHPGPGYDCTDNPCDDGDACNGLEECDEVRGCLPGAPMSCRDDDPCTTDTCAAGGCQHPPRDLDGDGHADPCAGGDDCAPLDPQVHPGAAEQCNGRDDDCDLDVDEDLPFGLVSERLLPEGVESPAFLDDGSMAGVRRSPTAEGYPFEAYIASAGETRAELLYDGTWIAPTNAAVLAAGVRAVVALALLPSVTDLLGRKWLTGQWVSVIEVRDDLPSVSRELAVFRPEDEVAHPTLVGLYSTNDGPVVVWSEDRGGERRIVAATVDPPGDPQVVAQAQGLLGLGMAPDPSGATVFWSLARELHVTRIDSGGAPIASAALGIETSGAFDVCAVPSGAVFAMSSGRDDEPVGIAIHSLGRDLLSSELQAELPEPDSERGYIHVELRCMGSSIIVLNSAVHVFNDVGYHDQWRVRHVTADGVVDYDEELQGNRAQFAAAPSPVLIILGMAFEYGCAP